MNQHEHGRGATHQHLLPVQHHQRQRRAIVVPPSFGASIAISPSLLTCAQILSGRSLLTASDLSRFCLPVFDHCAFLTEHVCDNDQTAVALHPRDITAALATLIDSALIMAAHSTQTMALTRTRNQATRTRFELHEPISPNQQSPPRLVPPNFMAGPMASAHISRIFAVVPRASPLSQLQSHTLPSNSNDPPPPPRGGLEPASGTPPPPPPGGGSEGTRLSGARVFQHDIGVSAPT